jgi:hypothetical protein
MVKKAYLFRLLGVPPEVSDLAIEFESTESITNVIHQLHQSYFLLFHSGVTLSKDNKLLDEKNTLADYDIMPTDIIEVHNIPRENLLRRGLLNAPVKPLLEVEDIEVQNDSNISNNIVTKENNENTNED